MENQSWSIGPLAGDDELDRVAAIEAASFSNPWTREALAYELEYSDVTRIYVLKDAEGQILAFCACWLVMDEIHINTLAVDPAMRRRGIGAALLGHVLADLSAAGARQATLEVRRSNTAAIQLYERLGFVVAAVRPKYYTLPDEDGLILWRHDLTQPPDGAHP
jgi:ribosomal-protein-alanine N-acetyltransferase